METNIRSDMRILYSFIGCIVAAPSVISLIQKLFEFGLATEMAKLLEFYRIIFSPISKLLWIPLNWILKIINIHIEMPEYFTYISMISITCGGLLAKVIIPKQLENIDYEIKYRKSEYNENRFDHKYSEIKKGKYNAAVMEKYMLLAMWSAIFGFISISCIGALTVIYILASMVGLHYALYTEEMRDLAELTGLTGWLTVLAVIGFYIFNHLLGNSPQ